jgi:hypothetical protein
MGIPCVNFFCDHVREYRRLPPEFAPFDLHWVPEHDALPLYRDRRWPALSAPMPCWVPPSQRHPPYVERPVLSFVGGRDPLRAALLAHTAGQGLPLEIRGPSWLTSLVPPARPPSPASLGARCADWAALIRRLGWVAAIRRASGRFASTREPEFDFSPFLHASPSDATYAEVVAGAAVSLGINRFPSLRHPARRPGTYSRLRDIEAPMLGACYLTEHAPGLDELYVSGTEIETYRDADELVAKARALLNDPVRRSRLRAAGQTRALREHSVGHALSRIAARLELALS